MCEWLEEGPAGCGTCACIGGWVSYRLYGGETCSWNARCERGALGDLCYGWPGNPKPEEAADAIERFLAMQDPWTDSVVVRRRVRRVRLAGIVVEAE